MNMSTEPPISVTPLLAADLAYIHDLIVAEQARTKSSRHLQQKAPPAILERIASSTPLSAQAIAADIAHEYRTSALRWTQRAWARNEIGKNVHYSDPEATCWCLGGAIKRRVPYYACDRIFQAFGRALVELRTSWPSSDFVGWQDQPERTVGDVIALCDKVAQS